MMNTVDRLPTRSRWNRFRRVALVANAVAVCLLLAAGTADAQILYNNLTQNGEQLRQVNPDGSGNIPLSIGNLPQAANPTVSGDGRRLAVRSSNPSRPNQFSTNVHVFDATTGNLQQITNFEDQTDPQTGATFNHSPRYTAFSPDGALIAISDFLNTQTTQSSSSTAFTSIYRVSDGELLEGPSVNGTASTLSTLGTGISWSPATNAVAVPSTSSNGATAIFAGNSFFNIPVQQLTFPQTGPFSDASGFGNFVEEDSFPTYSPNGQALAYFRSRDILTNTGYRPSLLSLRITSDAGDRSIFNFNPGFQPTGISWSPDGSQLAIGIGPQVVSGGTYFNLADPASAEVLLINNDGSGIRQLVGAPAISPAWSSLSSSGLAGDFDGDGDVDIGDHNAWRNSFGTTNAAVDGNGNGVVDLADYTVWRDNLGTGLGANGQVTAVPEPASVIPLALGGLLLVGGNCRRRKVVGISFFAKTKTLTA